MAGDPPVRFGGRGKVNPLSLPLSNLVTRSTDATGPIGGRASRAAGHDVITGETVVSAVGRAARQ
jgi:hypothetical protein